MSLYLSIVSTSRQTICLRKIIERYIILNVQILNSGVNMIYRESRSAYLFLVGVAVLFAVLFIGYLVPVKSVPSAPPGSGTSDIALLTRNWRADRAQYDPTYMDRLQELSAPAPVSSTTVTDWHAVREQYQPGYRAELSKKPAKTSHAGCGRSGY